MFKAETKRVKQLLFCSKQIFKIYTFLLPLIVTNSTQYKVGHQIAKAQANL